MSEWKVFPMMGNVQKIAILACNSEKVVYGMCVAEREFSSQTSKAKDVER